MSDIAEIKQRLDIVAVASQYVALQKSGSNFKALCPFHNEKTPSFYVFPERQSWHCFGCGVGGDIFALVMKKENLDFGGALRLLADKAGVPLAKDKGESAQRRPAFDLTEAAVEYYQRTLLQSAEAAEARAYLEKRSIGNQCLHDFQLGYSPRSGRALVDHLKGKGRSIEDMLAAGLVRGEGRLDLFRGRLMFPIRDGQGRALGFGARALDQSQPKYLNSPQTAIFDKGGTLYALDKALPAIRSRAEAVVVEGYFDAIAAHQKGFTNVIASMGTSITPRQVGLLKGAAKSLVLALDADAAGDHAALRGIQTARQSLERAQSQVLFAESLGTSGHLQAEIRIAALPQGRDPDEVINRSPEEWENLVGAALPVMDYLLQSTLSQFDMSRIDERSRAAERLLPYIAEVADAVKRQGYLQKLSRALEMPEATLREKAADLSRASRPGARPSGAPATQALSLRDFLEEHCLYLLLTYGLAPNELPLEVFHGSENRELVSRWLAAGTLEALRSDLDPALQDHLEALLALGERPLPPTPWQPALRRRQGMAIAMPLTQDEAQHALEQCLGRLQERNLRRLAQAGDSLQSQEHSMIAAQELKRIFRQRALNSKGG